MFYKFAVFGWNNCIEFGVVYTRLLFNLSYRYGTGFDSDQLFIAVTRYRYQQIPLAPDTAISRYRCHQIP